MDPVVLVVVIVVATPIAVLSALAISARLRAPSLRAESRRPVGPLVTDAIPEEHPQPDVVDESPDFDPGSAGAAKRRTTAATPVRRRR